MKPGLVITVDRRDQIALVRGAEARAAIRAVVVDRSPSWSPGGRGYIVPVRYVADIEAWGQAHRHLVVLTERKAA